ncbi:hypothetical protein TBLA_0B02520 [Henningerozyma blattae CBS 6284]|uniref:Exocyst complex component Sec8 n=1 Tax=Henningerozyma blattae (strain ATCC 34711 / CBS 6284 / DSM 70876 / NBRC 10599 / NRRL Y-10934 / UCD 77-7) TaxID=1071380 RepID=I2GY92_HENB6|nr:hypothetical protein TBLA_0B02520 [Tetrapisispora blattae CBS 6284]CCH59094.1 hypothetical protein TBLA_0B02520 [Tetrapisispora blattae CBS 6284]
MPTLRNHRVLRHRGVQLSNAPPSQDLFRKPIDELESDLLRVNAQWNNELSINTNPLELALYFLDETSIGLGHRVQEFADLQKKFGHDLRSVAYDNYESFNTNIASYDIAVDSINRAQGNISDIQSNMNLVKENITRNKGNLENLNEKSIIIDSQINILSAIEEMLVMKSKIENYMTSREYLDVQRNIVKSYTLANKYSLWEIPQLKSLKNELDNYEHTLFKNVMEEIKIIIYSKNEQMIKKTIIFENHSTYIGDNLTNIEDYLSSIINMDIQKQARLMNQDLKEFLESIKNLIPSKITAFTQVRERDSHYKDLFEYLTILRDIKRLPLALQILTNNVREELSIMITNNKARLVEEHPSLRQFTNSMKKTFGLSLKDILSVFIKEWFWQMFVRFSSIIQCHIVISESIPIILHFQSSTELATTYNLEAIWNDVFREITIVLNRYLNDPLLTSEDSNLDGSYPHPTFQKDKNDNNRNKQLFSLQANASEPSILQQQTSELKNLLTDLFPGFSISNKSDLSSVYISEEIIEHEKPLLPPSTFNMKFILDPFLFYCEVTSHIIPTQYNKKFQNPLLFFTKYMSNNFFLRTKATFSHLFNKNVSLSNPFTITAINNNKILFQSAKNFQDLFFDILFMLNTTNVFRDIITNSVIDLVEQLLKYYNSLFDELLGFNKDKFNKNIMNIWFQDEKLIATEKSILLKESKNDSVLEKLDTLLIFKHCTDFFQEGNGLEKDSIASYNKLKSIIHFTTTIHWLLEWLPELHKNVSANNNYSSFGSLDIDVLRKEWSFSESFDIFTVSKIKSLKICMDKGTTTRFKQIISKFNDLYYRLLITLRLDIRSRCIYGIGLLFKDTENWNLETDSIELSPHISKLVSSVNFFDNKFKKQISSEVEDLIFYGIDSVCDQAFISGGSSITVINYTGTKKMLKSIETLQLLWRNIVSDSTRIDMSKSLNYYLLCQSPEDEFFEHLETGNLLDYANEEIKVALRLSFSEEHQKYNGQLKSTDDQDTTVLSFQRYQNAVNRLHKSLVENHNS